METVTQFVERKSVYQETIRSLEAQRQVLTNQVNELRDRLEALELQRQIAILKNEVELLQTEKESLSKRTGLYTASPMSEPAEDPQL